MTTEESLMSVLGGIACILVGAVVLGGIGFVVGFFGPMYADPGAAQGPMLGIFFTGPLGALIGGVCGAIGWRRAKNKHSVDFP